MCCLLRACQFLLLVFIFFLNFHANISSSLCSNKEAAALIQFKNSFSVDEKLFSSSDCDVAGKKSYPKTDSWKEGTDCCSWDGVFCDDVNDKVIGLDLSCSCLYGTFPSNSSLFQLPQLQELNLAFNNFNNSNMSAKFGWFSSLVSLNLSQTLFAGPLPSEISYLSKLVSLDLSGNDYEPLNKHTFKRFVQNMTEVRHIFLDGINMSAINPNVLMNLSSPLRSLSLKGCNLRGKFPESIFHLPNLMLLTLANNENLNLSLPEFNQSSPLEHLDLSQTSLSGGLPNSIDNLASLKHLDIQFSYLSGSIPNSLGNLVSLEYLNLGTNDLSGSIPSSLGNLVSLKYLSFQQSNLSGLIPSSVGNLSQLSYLELSTNRFNGQIPSSLANLTQLEYLSLFDNQLEGSISFEVNAFPILSTLILSYNLLNGTLPPWLYTTSSLKHISLSNNQFSGHIMEFQSKSIEWISLGSNYLQGSIPHSVSQLINLTTLFLSSNNLSGNVDYELFSKLENLVRVYLSYNSLSLNSNGTSVDYTLPNLQSLYLSGCNVNEFPPFLRGSESLQYLDLSNNKIHGRIPEWMWEVGKDSLIYLNLSHNSLTEVDQLPWNGIQYLDLRSNLIHGDLPIPPLTTNVFLISNNSLSGEISSSICDVTSLGILDLSDNNLTGTIPQCFGNLSNSAWMLNLRRNKLHGIIPPTFAEGCLLRNLNLNGNQLQGPLTHSIINCTYLEVLDLGNNKINDTFPHWLESLQELQVLVLQSNKFHGSIHSTRSSHSFPKIQIFDLSSNHFTGPLPVRYIENFKTMADMGDNRTVIPYMGLQDPYGRTYSYSIGISIKGLDTELQKIFTMLTSIDLSNNMFGGEIPVTIGRLNSLRGLNLSHNSIYGSIPTSIGNLSSLEWLDLSSNMLDGAIPEELLHLTYLSFLNLSQNELVGQIPRGKQFSTFESTSFEENVGLCGFPLSRDCSNNKPPSDFVEEDDDSKSILGFGWKVVAIGYGCGLMFGLAAGLVVFRTGKPKWFVALVEKQQPKRRKR